MVICSPDNDTFIEAAECAGYMMADSYITVALDDVAEMELPAVKVRSVCRNARKK